MAHDFVVQATYERFHGRVMDVVSDDVVMPGGRVATRDYVRHPGAVAVLALDESDRVLMIWQYRHPIHRRLWELPAGLRDVADERPELAAARELAEEGYVQAKTWHTLADTYSSPGMCDEGIRTYLARDLTPVPDAERYQPDGDEEVDMERHWVPLQEAVARVLRGEVTNGPCQVGLLAAARSQADGWTSLRAPDLPWFAD